MIFIRPLYPGSLGCLDPFHPVTQQPDDAAFKIDAFDPIEFVLGAIMPGKYVLGRCLCLGGGQLTVFLPSDPLQRLFEFSRVVLGYDYVAFLVTLDIGRKRVPDQPCIAVRPGPLTPPR